MKPVCDLIEPLFENVKDDIFGELLLRAKPTKKKKKKDDNDGSSKQMLLSDIFKKKAV